MKQLITAKNQAGSAQLFVDVEILKIATGLLPLPGQLVIYLKPETFAKLASYLSKK